MVRFAAFSVILTILLAPALSDEPAALGVRIGDGADRPDSLRAVAVSPDARFVALTGEPETPSGDVAVQLRDAASGRLLRTLTGHESPVRSLAFSSRSDRLATVTADADGVGLTRLFDVSTGTLRWAVDAGGRLVRFLPDGRLVVAGPGRVLVLDAETGRETARSLAMPIVKDVTADGRRALGVSHHGRSELDVRDLGTGRTIVRLAGCTDEPITAVFSPDGRTVAASDARSRTLLLWEVLTGQAVHRLTTGTTITALTWTSDGRHLIAGGLDATIRVWEVATGSETGRLEEHEGTVTALACHPPETLLSGGTDRRAILWSLASVRGSALPAEPPSQIDLVAIWETLAGPDAPAAYRSLGRLASRPAALFPFVVGRVERQLVPVPDADLARLIAELDHADYRVREAATASLAKAGEPVRPYLERAYGQSPTPEVRSRLRLLLRRSGLTPRFSPGDLLRLRRLIGEAASSGGDDAKRLLRLIADELPDPAISGEASDALRRIK